MSGLILPALLLCTSLYARLRGTSVYEPLSEGIRNGVSVILRVFCSLCALMAAINMWRASGLMDVLSRLLAPILRAVGIPPEVAPIILIRPFSGSAALAAGAEIMRQYGPDSLVGRTAAVMLGSTETTFYTMTVYLSSAREKPPRFLLPAAICGDIAGFIASSLFVKLFFN